MVPITYNLRNLLERKATTLMTALGIGLTVAVLVVSVRVVFRWKAFLFDIRREIPIQGIERCVENVVVVVGRELQIELHCVFNCQSPLNLVVLPSKIRR